MRTEEFPHGTGYDTGLRPYIASGPSLGRKGEENTDIKIALFLFFCGAI
jgi:hypothetical protein